jgi:hypothetical protein
VHHLLADATTQTPVGATFTVAAGIFAVVVGSLVPLLTMIATKVSAHPLIKYVVTALLSLVASVVDTAFILPDGTAVVSWNTVIVAVVTFAVALAQYHSLYKPNNVPNSGAVLPNKGIG